MNKKWDVSLFFLLVLWVGVGEVWSGDYSSSILFGGLERTYRIHLPASRSPNEPMPLLFALHGGRGTGRGMEQLTLGGFNLLSDREGFVVVYPDGVEKHWNDGRGLKQYRSQRDNVDDVGFFSALIDHLSKELNIDLKRIYVTGISNGGMMSYRLACELSHRIAAIAPVASQIGEVLSLSCRPSRPVSVLIINGVEDPLVPWKGGEIKFGRLGFGKVLSAPETVRFWVSRNLCSPSPITSMEPDKDPKDGTRVRREFYGSCTAGTEVILYAIEGGGHTWPNGYQYLGENWIGKTSRDIDANEVIWSFFKK